MEFENRCAAARQSEYFMFNGECYFKDAHNRCRFVGVQCPSNTGPPARLSYDAYANVAPMTGPSTYPADNDYWPASPPTPTLSPVDDLMWLANS